MLQSVKTVQAASVTALHGIALGVALIRADGGILYANPAASAVINNGDILSLNNGALASGLQPALWGEWPGIGDILFALTVLGSLLLNIQRWGANGWTDDAHIYREG